MNCGPRDVAVCGRGTLAGRGAAVATRPKARAANSGPAAGGHGSTIRRVIDTTLSRVISLRRFLADVAALRWTRVRGVDLAVPAGLAIVAIALIDQLGRPIAGMPFWVWWLACSAVVLAVSAGLVRPDRVAPLRPVTLLVVPVVVSWLLFDVLLWQQDRHLYDLNVYLSSCGRWLDGGQPYMTTPIVVWPENAASDYFLYPPPLLPVFGLLSRLPHPAVAVGWTALLAVCAFAAFRLLGLRPINSLLMVAFPPVMIGIESGNIASLTLLLFALARRAGPGLVLSGLLKVQTGLPALWLVREKRWRSLVVGIVALAAIVLVTLPMTGADSWSEWWAGLGYRADSQAAAVALYGSSYARYLPSLVYVAIAAALVAVALAFRGRRLLAALGLASVFASPALWPHGFAFALPAVLLFESGTAVWLLLGAGSMNPSWWLLFYFGWLAVAAEPRSPDRDHPLAGSEGPWP